MNKVKAFDGSNHPETLPKMNCGGTPFFNYEAGHGYRCDTCYAVIGSFGQLDECKQMNDSLISKPYTELYDEGSR